MGLSGWHRNLIFLSHLNMENLVQELVDWIDFKSLESILLLAGAGSGKSSRVYFIVDDQPIIKQYYLINWTKVSSFPWSSANSLSCSMAGKY